MGVDGGDANGVGRDLRIPGSARPQGAPRDPGNNQGDRRPTEFATFDRAHFKEYGDSSLDFEVVYYVDGPEYNRYMDIQQEINLAIFEEFEARGIGFAYPTRTVFIEKQ